MMPIGTRLIVLLVTIGLITGLCGAARADQPYLLGTFTDPDGNPVDGVIVPPSPPPPGYVPSTVQAPVPQGAKVLDNVPSFTWAYGCSAVAAGMMMGYYDRIGYDKMYTGPANGGVCPINNNVWSASHAECPFVASHMGVDGRNVRGHVDDYWISVDNNSPDPYQTGGWAEHSPLDCTGDFMGTSQHKWNMPDGSTIFFYNSNSTPANDVTWCEPGNRDGCHGMKLYAQSKGYTVTANYNQYILGYKSSTAGFTFQQFMSEIDAGYPVLIQLEGHTMIGYGYDNTNGAQTVYIHNTWDTGYDTMTWGGSYSKYGYGPMKHCGVTVFHLAPVKVETPTFSPTAGVYYQSMNVTMNCATSGATIHYTINGSDPTESDPTIAAGASILVDKTETIRLKAFKSGIIASDTAVGSYTMKVRAPVLIPSSGTYQRGQNVMVTCETTGAEIHYTTNGRDPLPTDPLVGGPIAITQNCTLKVKGFKTNWTNSDTTYSFYTMYDLVDIKAVKGQSDGVTIRCAGGIVTSAIGDTFYIESPDRTTGIQASMYGHGFTPGTNVDVVGTLRTINGERCINALNAYVMGFGSINPVAMSLRDLGGITSSYNPTTGAGQMGFSDGRGPNNVGLLVKVWGQFNPVNSTRFNLTDGNESVDCIVPSGVIINPYWQYLTVTGISSCEPDQSGGIRRVIKVASQDDIVSARGAMISGKVTTASNDQIVNTTIESAHPYTCNLDQTWSFTAPGGTSRVRAHFVRAQVQTNHDYLYISDSTGSTVQTYTNGNNVYDFWSDWVTGTVMRFRLVTDSVFTCWGFQIDKFECQTIAVPISGAAVTLTPGPVVTASRGDGSFYFDTLAAGNYNLIASLAGATVSPSNLTVSVGEDEKASNEDFECSSTRGSIGGKVYINAYMTAVTNVQSPHPYPGAYDNTWTISAPAGASQIRAHFNEIELESGLDYLYIKNAAGADQQILDYNTPTYDWWSNWVDGNVLQFRLTTNSSNNRYGFAIDKYDYMYPTPVGGVVVSVSPGGLSTITTKDGSFLFYGLADGTYVLTPSLLGRTFTPASQSIVLSGNSCQLGVNFARN